MKTISLGLCAVVLAGALAGCGQKKEEPPPPDTGRKETRAIEAVGNVGGYDGKAVRKKLDKALDTNDQRVDQLNQDIESQDH